jgi:hypothetical protein
MSTKTAERPEQAASAKPSQPVEQRRTAEPKTPRTAPEPVFTDWASI